MKPSWRAMLAEEEHARALARDLAEMQRERYRLETLEKRAEWARKAERHAERNAGRSARPRGVSWAVPFTLGAILGYILAGVLAI